tara:strand:- start:400 stop:1119 length:720 start_codon:yes stop_codon:yes gene_type:complete
MNFVILAAGLGSRLRPLTDQKPKCCIEVNNESLIIRFINQINKFYEKKNIIIVTGYKEEFLKKHLKSFESEIIFVNNQNYETSNNMYSAYLGIKNIDPSMNTVIANADCIYADNIFKILSCQKRSTILIDKNFFDEESMKVKLKDKFIVSMGKQLKSSKDVFVSLDMYLFESMHIERLEEIFKEYFRKNQYNSWTEVAINNFVKIYNNSIQSRDIGNEKWAEIDNITDLERAKSLWKST